MSPFDSNIIRQKWKHYHKENSLSLKHIYIFLYKSKTHNKLKSKRQSLHKIFMFICTHTIQYCIFS